MGVSDVAQSFTPSRQGEKLVSCARRGGRADYAAKTIAGVGASLEKSGSGCRRQASKSHYNIALGCISPAKAGRFALRGPAATDSIRRFAVISA